MKPGPRGRRVDDVKHAPADLAEVRRAPGKLKGLIEKLESKAHGASKE